MPTKARNIIVSEYFDNHLVEIRDEDNYRSLYFADDSLQSRISFIDPNVLILLYTQYMMSALLVQPEPANVLLIGIGAGALVRFLHHHFPHCAIDAVDNSEQIIRMAVSYFHMPNKAPITIHCCDGYDFLTIRQTGRPYDLMLIDAFDEKGMSKTIYAEDFFRSCMESLTPDGVLSCNLWSCDSEELRRVKNGIQQHATSELYLPVPNRGNIIALAFKTPPPWQKIDRPKGEISSLSQRFRIELGQIVAVAKKSNMTLGQKINAFFL